MILRPYKETGKFRFWCQHVLPQVYDDSLSYYELLCRVVNYLNDLIENTAIMEENIANINLALEELRNYVENYFSTLDVQEEINNRLDELVENGTLESLLTQRILPDEIATHKIGSYVSTSGGTPQGFAVHNKIIYEATIYKNDEVNALITKRDMNTGSILASNKIAVGHANSICYDRVHDTLIVLDGIVNPSAFYVVSTDTLEIVSSHSTGSVHFGSVVWDVVEEKAVLFGVRDDRTMVKADLNSDMSLGDLEEAETVDFDISFQNGLIIGNYIIMISGNNVALVYNKENLKFIRMIPIAKYTDNVYFVGEVEQWCIDVDGTIYGNSGQYMGSYENEQYGEWLVMHYEVGLFNSYSYSHLITVRTRPNNFGSLYCTGNTHFAYRNSGFDLNPCYITEAINANIEAGLVPTLVSDVEKIYVNRNTVIYTAGHSINKLAIENCEVFVSRASITNLLMNNAKFKTGEQTVITALNAKYSVVDGYITIGIIVASYSTIIINKCTGSLALTGSKIEGDIVKEYIAEAAKRGTVYVITGRGCYIVTRGNGTYKPISQTVAYDTDLVVNGNSFTEKGSGGSYSEATISRVYSR